MNPKTKPRDQYDGSLHLLFGFQRLKPITTITTIVPRRVRYMYVDRLVGDSISTNAMFKQAGISSLKYESVEPSHADAALVVVKCSIKRKEAESFLHVMAERHKQMKTLGVRGYGDFCMGLHIGALRARQEVHDESNLI